MTRRIAKLSLIVAGVAAVMGAMPSDSYALGCLFGHCHRSHCCRPACPPPCCPPPCCAPACCPQPCCSPNYYHYQPTYYHYSQPGCSSCGAYSGYQYAAPRWTQAPYYGVPAVAQPAAPMMTPGPAYQAAPPSARSNYAPTPVFVGYQGVSPWPGY